MAGRGTDGSSGSALAGSRDGRPGAPRIRLDKWLWQARFFKSRSLAAGIVLAGHVRVNGVHAAKPSAPVGAGDVLTFPQGARIRVVRLLAVGQRRGPPSEAQGLYADLGPSTAAAAAGAPGAGPP